MNEFKHTSNLSNLVATSLFFLSMEFLVHDMRTMSAKECMTICFRELAYSLLTFVNGTI